MIKNSLLSLPVQTRRSSILSGSAAIHFRAADCAAAPATNHTPPTALPWGIPVLQIAPDAITVYTHLQSSRAGEDGYQVR